MLNYNYSFKGEKYMSAFDYLKGREALAKDIINSALDNKKLPWEIPYTKNFPKNIFAKQDQYNGYNAIYLITQQQKREASGTPVGYRYIAQSQLEKQKTLTVKKNAQAYNVEYWGLGTPKNAFTIKKENNMYLLLNSEYKRVTMNSDKNVLFDFVLNAKGFIYKGEDKKEFLAYIDSTGANSINYERRYKQTGKPFCKQYLVYNESDLEGDLPITEPVVQSDFSIIDNFIKNNPVKLVPSNSIAYIHTEEGDSFLMPEKKNFKDENSFYSTYLYCQLLKNIQESTLAVKENDPFKDVLSLRNQIIAQMSTLLLSVELKQQYNPQEFTQSNLLAELAVKIQGLNEKESFIEKFGDLDAFVLKSFSLANTFSKNAFKQIIQFKVEDKVEDKTTEAEKMNEKLEQAAVKMKASEQKNIFKMGLM